jgi:hypothetical protein
MTPRTHTERHLSPRSRFGARWLLLLSVALLWTLTAVIAEAGRGGGRPGSPATAGQSSSAGQRAGQPSGQGQRVGSQAGKSDRIRDRIHLTTEQRDRFRDTRQAADRLRDQSRALRQMTDRRSFRPDDARLQRDRVRDQVHAALQEHDRMMQGFSEGDRRLLQDRSRELDRSRQRMETCLENLDRQLGNADPDRRRVATEARELHRATGEWQKQQRKMGEELGI